MVRRPGPRWCRWRRAHISSLITVSSAARGARQQCLGVGHRADAPRRDFCPGGTQGNGQVSLNWVAPVSDGGSAITDYDVSVFDGSGGVATGVTGATSRSVGSASASYTFTGLTNGTAYMFRAEAVNVFGPGPASALSDMVTPQTVADAPLRASRARPLTVKSRSTWTAPTNDGGAAVTDYAVSVFDGAGTRRPA